MKKQKNVLELRVTKRALRHSFMAVALTLGHNAFALESIVLWPSEGSFPAYPRDESRRNVRFYADTMVAYDDNIFRISDRTSSLINGESSRDDFFVRGSVGVDARLKSSRQELLLGAEAQHYTFDKYSFLNRWLYQGDIDWRWMVGDRLKGDFGYQASLEYPNFAELQFASDDVIRLQYAHAGIDLRLIRGLTLRALAEGSDAKHDDPARAELNNRVKAGTVGLFYVGKEGGAIGVQHKVSEGDYPNSQVVGVRSIYNNYREYESSVMLTQQPLDKLSGELRVGYTKREHEQVPQRDFKGTTGHINLRYLPRSKIMLDLSAYRELRAVEDLSASYAVVRGGTIGPSWAPTVKWVGQLAYVYEKRELLGSPTTVLIATEPRRDTTRTARLIVGYEPNRWVKSTLTYENGSRSSNIAFADFRHNSIALNVTLSL